MQKVNRRRALVLWAIISLILAAALGRAQVLSRPLEAPIPGGMPTRWALVVGVDAHDDPAYAPNPVAAQAAQSLRDGLMAAPGTGAQQRLALVTGAAATRAGILTTLREMLAQAASDDILLLHFSGHAVKAADGGLVLMAKDSLLADPAYTGLPFALVTEGIAASRVQKAFITLDTSFAAAAAPAVDRAVLAGKDIFLLAATGPNELLPQFTEPRSGPFVHFLREGLDGPADSSGNLLITAREAAEYVVREWAAWLQSRNVALTPGVFGGSGQFAVVDLTASIDALSPSAAPPTIAPEPLPVPSPTALMPPTPSFPPPPVALETPTAPPPAAAPSFAAATRIPGERIAALLIGINTYESPRLTPLSAPMNDVALMRETLVRAMGADIGRIITLTEQAATYDGILSGAQRAGQMTGPEDVLLFYFAGHAARVPDPMGDLQTGTSYMLCPRDMQMTGQNILPMRTLAEVLAKAPARRVVLVLEAMNAAVAGLFLTPLAAAGKEYVLPAACGADQFSFEMDFPLPDGTSVRQSAFTHYLAQGLYGLADLSRDNRITAAEAVEYARMELDRKGHSQRPELIGPAGNIVLASTTAEEGALTAAAAAAQAVAAAAEAAAAARLPATMPTTPETEEKKPEPSRPAATAPPPAIEEAKTEPAPEVKEEQKTPPREEVREKIPEKPKTPAGPPKKWAVIVGINRYASPALPELPGAVNDSREMRALLVDTMGFKSPEVTVLTDAKATREAILAAIRTLREKVGPNDLVLFYFSGHSAMFAVSGAHGEELVLCSHDTRLIEDGVTLSFRELMAALAELPVKQRVAILETSRAAAGAASVERAVAQGKKSLLLAACDAGESTKDARLTISGKDQLQGAFTYFLTQGLRGEAAAARSAARRISLKDAVDYAAKKLHELSYGQKPRLIGEPADFVLSAPMSAE